MNSRRRDRARVAGSSPGFALIDVLLALSLLSVGIVALLGALQNSVRVVRDAEAFTRAEILAEALFAGWRVDVPEIGGLNGRSSDGGITWRLAVKEWSPDWDQTDRGASDVGRFRRGLRLAILTLQWSEGTRSRELTRQELLRVDGGA